MSLGDFLGYAFAALMLVGWLYLTVEYVRAAIRGRFSFWRRRAGKKTWPPVRAERPLAFWVIWTLMAGPILILTALMLTGVIMVAFQA